MITELFCQNMVAIEHGVKIIWDFICEYGKSMQHEIVKALKLENRLYTAVQQYH